MNFLDQFFTALLALGSAGFGAFIAWVASVVVHRRQARVQKIDMLRSKLEVVMLACQQIYGWQEKQIYFFVMGDASFRDPNVYSDAPEIIPEAFLKIQCLQSLYFAKKLNVQTNQLQAVIGEFGQAMLTICQERRDSMLKRPDQERYPSPADCRKRLTPLLTRVADAQTQLIVATKELMVELDREQTKVWTLWRPFNREKS